MLTSLHIQEFKGLRDINIPELRKVNLVLGGHNVGKTSLLEAVVFVAGDFYENNESGARSRLAEMFRPCEGKDRLRFWRNLVGTEHSPTRVLVSATVDSVEQSVGIRSNNDKSEKLLEIKVEGDEIAKLYFSTTDKFYFLNVLGSVNPQPFPSFLKSALDQVELYGQLVTGRRKKLVLKLMQKIDCRLESIDAVAPDGEHRVYVELVDGNRLLPLSELGHGFTRLFELYAGLAVTASKLALIDEIENGIHYSALPTLFQGVRELSESNGVQSIITTHSCECIRAAYETFAHADSLKDLQLIRLERDGDKIRAVVINDEALKTVMEAGYEIR